MKSVEHKWIDEHDELGPEHHMEIREGVELDSIQIIDYTNHTIEDREVSTVVSIVIPPALVAQMLDMILEGRVIHTLKVGPHGYNPDNKTLGER